MDIFHLFKGHPIIKICELNQMSESRNEIFQSNKSFNLIYILILENKNLYLESYVS